MIPFQIVMEKMSKSRKKYELDMGIDNALYNCRLRRKKLFDDGILSVNKTNDNCFELRCNGRYVCAWSKNRCDSLQFMAICHAVEAMR